MIVVANFKLKRIGTALRGFLVAVDDDKNKEGKKSHKTIYI